MDNTLSVIIVDYKSLKQSLKYVEHLQEKIVGYSSIHYIIVDNNPQATANQYEIVMGNAKDRKQIDGYECFFYTVGETELVIVLTHNNNGYARGNNIGIRISEALYSDSIFLVSNNDLIAQTDLDVSTIARIFQEDNTIALVGPKIISLDGKDQSPRKNQSFFNQCFIYYWNSVFSHCLEKYASNVEINAKAKKVDWLMGAFVFIRKSAFDEVGGYDEATFLFGEEMILSSRLGEKGYTNYYFPSFCVLHNHGKTVKSTFDIVQGNKIALDSILYYYKEYRSVSELQCKLARLNFRAYSAAITFKTRLKRGKK